MSDKLLYEQDGHVVTLTMNNPDSMNAMTDHDMCAAIVEACSGNSPSLTSRFTGPPSAHGDAWRSRTPTALRP